MNCMIKSKNYIIVDYDIEGLLSWLNEKQYKTPRGHEFKNNHVHSILKKRRIRNEIINKPYELIFGEWYIKEIQ